MNKHQLISLIVLMMLGSSSCLKTLPGDKQEPFDFTISEVRDLSLPANGSATFAGTVRAVSGNPEHEPFSITFTGLPPNIVFDSSIKPFRANYSLNLQLMSRNATQGTYPVKAIFSTGKLTKVVDFNVTVAPPIDRVKFVTGYYYPSSNCGFKIYVTCEIVRISGSPWSIMLIDRTTTSRTFSGTLDTTFGMVDTFTNTFRIPLQKVRDVMVQGSGTFSDYKKSVFVEKTVTTDSSEYICRYQLTD